VRRQVAEFAVMLLLGNTAVTSFRRGLFRDSGEIHHMMYDRFSLRLLLASHGFSEIECFNASFSRIPNFASFSLEIRDGVPLKPDSLYMEAIKL